MYWEQLGSNVNFPFLPVWENKYTYVPLVSIPVTLCEGDILHVVAQGEVTTRYRDEVGIGRVLTLSTEPLSATQVWSEVGTSLNPATMENITQQQHHQPVNLSTMYKITESGNRYVNLVMYAATCKQNDGHGGNIDVEKNTFKMSVTTSHQ
eukprot:TRINITY_DN59050_c0_g1_i1.p1 TRINITY_DN59050_c0_g1~~TRINITY_DN59050_c0_g1_i1.p1  ORF type:complete len:151 (+),score=2.05 TRINITY_DN59050_c0_g1_i1:35-487(+)